MALPMTYSRRKRIREREGETLPFRSGPFGRKLLTQLFQLIEQMNGLFRYDDSLFSVLVKYAQEEKGVIALASAYEKKAQLYDWFIADNESSSDIDHDVRLDIVEVACSLVLERGRKVDRVEPYGQSQLKIAIDLVQSVNERMMEDGFGFQFKEGQVVEFTSEFAYVELIVPALGLLSDPIFINANKEFRDAFEEFKLRKYDDSIADCGNAFESTIKVIASRKGWDDVNPNDGTAKLIEALYTHGLIPAYMREQMKGLRMMLQGAGTLRNKQGGHGAGDNPRDIGRHLAAYQLHQTAAAILFIVDQANL